MEKLESKDASESRNWERSLDQKEFEIARAKERSVEAENKCRLYSKRISELEIQVASGQDALFSKDIALKEEQQRAKTAEIRVQDMQKTMESEITSYRQQMHDEKARAEDAALKHRLEMEQFKREVEENLPGVAEATASRIEKTWEKRMSVEIGSLKLRYESEIEALKKEIMELNASFAERDARRRVTLAEERAELENLRGICYNLKQSVVAGGMGMINEGGGDENIVGQSLSANQQSMLAGQRRSTMNRQRQPLQAVNTTFISSTDERRGNISAVDVSNIQPEAFNRLQAELHSMKYQLSASLRVMTPRVPLTTDQLRTNTLSKSNALLETNVPATSSSVFSSPQPVDASVSRAIYGAQQDSRLYFGGGDMNNSNDNGHEPGGSLEVGALGEDNFNLSQISLNDGGFHAGYWKAKYNQT